MENHQSPHVSRRLIWICGGAVLAVAALYSSLWLMFATSLRDVAMDWVNEQRAKGWAIAVHAPRIHGFPKWPAIDLPAVSVTAPLEDGGWSWQADILTLEPAAFDLTRLTVHAPGTHLVSAPLVTNGSWTLHVESAAVELDLDSRGKWQGARIDFDQAELRDSFERPWIGAVRIDATLALADNSSGPGDVFANFTGAADALRFGVRLGPFDRTMRALRLEANLVGPINPGRLSEALEAWRSDGGKLEVRRVLLDWPPLAIAGDGTMALDDRLQPIGTFSTRITGFNETLKSMEAGGILPRSQAESAQIILGLLAKTPRGSDEPELSLPLSVQDQRLSVGPFNLMDVPEVGWE